MVCSDVMDCGLTECLLQKFLRSHTKKKATLSRSPSLSQVKLSVNGFEQRVKSCDLKGFESFFHRC